MDDIDEDDLPRTPAALHQRLRILPSRQRKVQKTNNAAKSENNTFDVQSGGEAANSPLTETKDAGDGDAVKRNASYCPRARARARVSARGGGGSGNGGDGASGGGGGDGGSGDDGGENGGGGGSSASGHRPQAFEVAEITSNKIWQSRNLPAAIVRRPTA